MVHYSIRLSSLATCLLFFSYNYRLYRYLFHLVPKHIKIEKNWSMEMCSNSIFIPLTIYYVYLLFPILHLIITTYVHVFLSQDEVSILIRHFKKTACRTRKRGLWSDIMAEFGFLNSKLWSWMCNSAEQLLGPEDALNLRDHSWLYFCRFQILCVLSWEALQTTCWVWIWF